MQEQRQASETFHMQGRETHFSNAARLLQYRTNYTYYELQ